MTNSSEISLDQRVNRHERSEEIIADFERQHDFKLPQPWHPTVGTLLLRGLGDPSLNLIFETLMLVEFEAGRLADRPAPIAPLD